MSIVNIVISILCLVGMFAVLYWLQTSTNEDT